MIKSILAAADGSGESLAALEQAFGWAGRLGAELRVVFVQDERRFVTYPTYTDSEGSVPKPIPLEGEALRQVESEVAWEEGEVRGAYERLLISHPVRAALSVTRGAVERSLIRDAHGVDLVVLGKRGRGLDESVEQAGPTTETLIHRALRPVLVVPRDARTTGPVLVPFDGSVGVQRAIVPGVQLALAFKAPLTVLTVATHTAEGEEIQAPLRAYLRPHGVQADFRIVEGKRSQGEVTRQILDSAEALKAGLIVMGAFSQSPLREFFLGSVTRDVLGNALCPVLMMT